MSKRDSVDLKHFYLCYALRDPAFLNLKDVVTDLTETFPLVE
jgi:hypothetical protein